METIRKLGLLALASRLKRLSDRLMQDVGQVYRREELGFEPRWFLVFYQLAEGAPLSITALAGAVGITHPAVNQAADEMEQAGLVASSRDAKDKRRRHLALTPRGREVAAALRPIWADIESATRDVAESTGVDLLRAIDAIEAALDAQAMSARVEERLGRRREVLARTTRRKSIQKTS